MAFEFEDQVVDPGRRELRRGGAPVEIEPRVFDLLVHLIENRDRVVGKDDLIAHVWKGWSVSDSALTSAINAARRAVGDDGRAQRLIRTSARKGYRFTGTVGPSLPDAPATGVRATAGVTLGPSASLSDRPTVAVLPFLTVEGDPGQEFFADGMVEDITTALSRFRSLFVVSRNSSFASQGKASDSRQVGRELGVRYVVEGSVRRQAGRVRIAAQLIDVATGTHLWADRFDSPLNEVFDVQDRLTERIVGALVPRFEAAEQERARRKPTSDLGAYECFLRGMAKVHEQGAAAWEEALRMFGRAIELDPDFAAPYALSARYYVVRRMTGRATDPAADSAEVRRLVGRASVLGRDDPLALCWAGHSLLMVCGEHDSARELVEHAIHLNPHLVACWQTMGSISMYDGRHDTAVEQLKRALRFSPVGPDVFHAAQTMSVACYCRSRYEDAYAWAQRALMHHPTAVIALQEAAMAQAMMGNRGHASTYTERAMKAHPGSRIGTIMDLHPMRRAADAAHVAEGLRRAGFPG